MHFCKRQSFYAEFAMVPVIIMFQTKIGAGVLPRCYRSTQPLIGFPPRFHTISSGIPLKNSSHNLIRFHNEHKDSRKIKKPRIGQTLAFLELTWQCNLGFFDSQCNKISDLYTNQMYDHSRKLVRRKVILIRLFSYYLVVVFNTSQTLSHCIC